MSVSNTLSYHFDQGLSPSSQYRVTVRAKHSRAPGQPPQHPPPEEAPGAYTDFRTLTKGLPDPPQVYITYFHLPGS